MCPAGDSSERSTSRVAERTPDPVVEDPDSTPRGWWIQDGTRNPWAERTRTPYPEMKRDRNQTQTSRVEWT